MKGGDSAAVCGDKLGLLILCMFHSKPAGFRAGGGSKCSSVQDLRAIEGDKYSVLTGVLHIKWFGSFASYWQQ
jgi:hypothetical protein